MMKKVYMKPQAEIVRLETTSIIAGSGQVGLNKDTEVSNTENLLGHDDDFDW